MKINPNSQYGKDSGGVPLPDSKASAASTTDNKYWPSWTTGPDTGLAHYDLAAIRREIETLCYVVWSWETTHRHTHSAGEYEKHQKYIADRELELRDRLAKWKAACAAINTDALIRQMFSDGQLKVRSWDGSALSPVVRDAIQKFVGVGNSNA